MEISMANVISDETIEYVGILAKLELSDEEKEAAKKDMGRMLDYIDKLSELDTTGVEPMSHVFPVQRVNRPWPMHPARRTTCLWYQRLLTNVKSPRTFD